MKAINPTTGELIRDYPEHSPAEAHELLDRAGLAFEAWRDRPIGERASLLRAVAAELRACRAELAALATDAMGKTLAAAKADPRARNRGRPARAR